MHAHASTHCGFPESSPFTKPFSCMSGDVTPLLARPFSSATGTGEESLSSLLGAGAGGAGVSGSVGTGIVQVSSSFFVRAQIAFAKVAADVTILSAFRLSARC